MKNFKASVNIIGGGIFGVTAALELCRRGYQVSVFDRGELPHPQASSTDITKMIRADYGADTFYADLMHEAFQGWDEWNIIFPRPLYHETGFLLLTLQPLQSGSLEAESLKTLGERDYPIQRLSRNYLKKRFPRWNSDEYVDGYYNARGGWAESGNVVAQLINIAQQEGVQFYKKEEFVKFTEENDKITGVITSFGQKYLADYHIVAAGAWTPYIIPELHDCIKTVGQPVFHLLPERPELFHPNIFPGWSADISKTGWYGFPALDDGIVKVANHGIGIEKHPSDEQEIPEKYEAALRTFLQKSLPDLADAPIVKTRICMYCDTWDSDFYIDYCPEKEGLMVATGGSGHGFKFAPVLGKIIADVFEKKPNPYKYRFEWRQPGAKRVEAARSVNF